MTAQQQIHVKVFDVNGGAIAHGHTEARLGPFWDELDSGAVLEGVELALAGTPSSGVETSDEIGLALRGYAPVRRDGLTGPVVGAVMLADPLFAGELIGLGFQGGRGEFQFVGEVRAADLVAGGFAADGHDSGSQFTRDADLLGEVREGEG